MLCKANQFSILCRTGCFEPPASTIEVSVFNSWPLLARFMMHDVALGQIFLLVLRFPLSVSFCQQYKGSPSTLNTKRSTKINSNIFIISSKTDIWNLHIRNRWDPTSHWLQEVRAVYYRWWSQCGSEKGSMEIQYVLHLNHWKILQNLAYFVRGGKIFDFGSFLIWLIW